MAILQELIREIEKRREIDTKLTAWHRVDTKGSFDRVGGQTQRYYARRWQRWVMPKVSRTTKRAVCLALLDDRSLPEQRAALAVFLQNCLAQQIERARAIRGRCNP